MSPPSTWSEVKARARALDPDWDGPERLARRARMRERMLSSVSGAQLAEVRRQLGVTHARLAEATGLSQARISQIENGVATGLDTLRAYITGLGGRIDVVARIGNIQVNIA